MLSIYLQLTTVDEKERTSSYPRKNLRKQFLYAGNECTVSVLGFSEKEVCEGSQRSFAKHSKIIVTLPNCRRIYPKLGISFLQKHMELMETEYGFEIDALDTGFYFVFFGTACLIPILLIQFAQISYLPSSCTVEHQERMTIRNISMKLPLLYLS